MQHSTPTPNYAERLRFERIREIGCLACLQDRRYSVPEINHIAEGGRRRGKQRGGGRHQGHSNTYGICGWHHRGVTPDGWSTAYAEAHFGPSMARNPRAFRERFGSHDELLARQNQLIEAHYGPPT